MPASSEIRWRPGAIYFCSVSKISFDLGPGTDVLIDGSFPSVAVIEWWRCDSLFEFFLRRLARAAKQTHRAACDRASGRSAHAAITGPVTKVDNRKTIATQDRVATPYLEPKRSGRRQCRFRQRAHSGFGNLRVFGMNGEIGNSADAVKFDHPPDDFLLQVGEADSAPCEIGENRFD